MSVQTNKPGFTLVEIMIVVAIIGLLAALGLPSMLEAGKNARSRRIAREIKAAGHAFVQYAFDTGAYPADKTPGQIPDGMAPYLGKFPWSEKTTIGGKWDWDHNVFGVKAAVSVRSSDWGDEQMLTIDELIDNGDLGSGQFRRRSGGYMYVLEELN